MSACVPTLELMSSRVRSEFGTLGERVAAMTRGLPDDRPVDPARHVGVKTYRVANSINPDPFDGDAAQFGGRLRIDQVSRGRHAPPPR